MIVLDRAAILEVGQGTQGANACGHLKFWVKRKRGGFDGTESWLETVANLNWQKMDARARRFDSWGGQLTVKLWTKGAAPCGPRRSLG